MKWIVLAATWTLLAACHKEAPPHAIAETAAVPSESASVSDAAIASASTSANVTRDASPMASASASASVAPAPRVVCGAGTCGPKQYCLHYDSGAGGADLPNKVHGDATMCSDTVPNSGGMRCRPTNAARQCSCSALIPRAPPQGNGNLE